MNSSTNENAAPEMERTNLLDLGAWMGRRQAFGMIANRCSAADAECLKRMRDGNEYKKLGLSWAGFCRDHLGISRAFADRLIQHLDEFGANYFRIAELIPISAGTYRLLAGQVSDENLEVDGKRIPLKVENRKEVAAAVETLRARAKLTAAPAPSVETISRRLKSVFEDVKAATLTGHDRLMLLGMLEEGARRLREKLLNAS